MSKSSLKAALTCEEVSHLIAWYEESYDCGWRPGVHVPTTEERFRETLAALKHEHLTARRPVKFRA